MLLGSKFHSGNSTFRLRDYHPLWSAFPDCSAKCITIYGKVAASPELIPLPLIGNACKLLHQLGLGSSPFAHHYLGNRSPLSLPWGTKMFQFPQFPSLRVSP